MKKKIYSSLLLLSLFICTTVVEAKMTKEAHALYQQACSFEYKNNYEAAINTIKQALDVNGEDAMLYTKIAGLYSEVGKYEDALSAYKQAVRLRPNDAFIYISIGNILQTLGDYENAYNAFSHAQKIYPEYKYNYLNLANIEYFRKNYGSAIENYNLFLSAYPNHMEASDNLANVYLITKNYSKACEIYQEIYKKYPSAFTEYEKYGITLFETKQYQVAAEMFEKALVDNENSEVINAKLALVYQNLGKNELSIDYFKKVFNINPNLTALRLDYANLLGNVGAYKDAQEQYKIYLKAFPDDAVAYRNLGIVYKNDNNKELALFNLEKSYSIDSSSVATQKELANCYHMSHDYVNALKFYNFALKIEPDNIELLANKALTLHAMDNYIAAIELYRDILAKQPNERIKENLTVASITYAYDLLDKEDYGQSILYFEDAILLNDKSSSAYYGLACANEKIGYLERALEEYQKAVSLAPGNLDYIKALENVKNKISQSENEILSKETNLESEDITIITTPITEAQLTYDDLINMANEAFDKQKYEIAIDYYTKAIIYNPSDYDVMLRIANSYKILGDNKKAINFYKKTIDIDNENTDSYFNLGLVYANQKDYENCIKCFEKVIELSPDYPYAYYSLALAHEQKGDITKALEYYYLYTGLETDSTVLDLVNQKIKKLENK